MYTVHSIKQVIRTRMTEVKVTTVKLIMIEFYFTDTMIFRFTYKY